LASGPIMFLLAQGWYLYRVPRVRPTLYIAGVIAFILSTIVGFLLSAWIYHVVIGMIFVVISYFERRVYYDN